MGLEPGGHPETGRDRIVVVDDSVDSHGSALAQMLLRGRNQVRRHPAAATVGMNDESVQVSAPSVPTGDHGADQLSVNLRDEEHRLLRSKEAVEGRN